MLDVFDARAVTDAVRAAEPEVVIHQLTDLPQEFDPDKVAENAVIVSGGADPHQILKQMLHEYVSFAHFSTGAMLGPAVEASLSKAVAPMLAALLPQG